MEYPTHGIGDFREDCLRVKTKAGHSACQLTYLDHEIFEGKKKLEGLPATFGDEKDCTTLELHCIDDVLDLKVTLVYTAFKDVEAITRSVRVENRSLDDSKLTRVYSTCLDMDDDDYDMITLHGSWARERHVERRRVSYGKQGAASIRGESSHQDHPFLALLQKNANEDQGEVYGFNFVYSGNFIAQAEKTQFDKVRVVMGINDTDFEWHLRGGEAFTTIQIKE